MVVDVDRDGDLLVEFKNAPGCRFYFDQNWVEPVNFTKDDIQEFDIVELRDGRMVIVSNPYLCEGNPHGELIIAPSVTGFYKNDYEEDFCFLKDGESDLDIMKIYRPMSSIPTNREAWKDLPIVWERKSEVKEMTMKEISDALGYEVKVVE